MHKQIAAIVVTFNRKELLSNCIQSLKNQTLLPNKILIIDNASNDGTDVICEEKFRDDPLVDYIRLPKNIGGAGGFYSGIEKAFSYGYDFFWLMDDDGVPDSDQLKVLLENAKYDAILNPLVVDINHNERLSFGLGGCRYVSEIKNNILGEINAFNGTFISREIVVRIGNIKQEMFIWGDESEYCHRAKANNITLITIAKAKHYHPAGKVIEKKYGRLNLYLKPNDRMHIFLRNLAFIEFNYNGFKGLLKMSVKYMFYYLISGKVCFAYKLLKYILDGALNRYKLPI
ncbi:MAG: glycosyltransferase [Candidatus Atribacteria bacterium]|nr:glycosyltransferase [Candidatus Atribacteria bacterium]